jgi:hypothetical protein
VLRRGGAFVAKIFRGDCLHVLLTQLRCLFADVRVVKPLSSRPRSAEAFVVCQRYRGNNGADNDAGNRINRGGSDIDIADVSGGGGGSGGVVGGSGNGGSGSATDTLAAFLDSGSFAAFDDVGGDSDTAAVN